MYTVSPNLKPLTLIPEVFEYVAGKIERDYRDYGYVFGLCSIFNNLIHNPLFINPLPYSDVVYRKKAAEFHMALLSVLMSKKSGKNYWWPSNILWLHNEQVLALSPRIIACQLAAEVVRDIPKTPTEAWRKKYYRTAVFLNCKATEGLCCQMASESRELVTKFGHSHWYAWDLEDASRALLKGPGNKIRTTSKKSGYWWYNPQERKLALSELIHRAFIEDIRNPLHIY